MELMTFKIEKFNLASRLTTVEFVCLFLPQ